MTDFYEIQQEIYAAWGHSNSVIFNFLHSVITTWGTNDRVRREWH